jgi:hypothetical protein
VAAITGSNQGRVRHPARGAGARGATARGGAVRRPPAFPRPYLVAAGGASDGRPGRPGGPGARREPALRLTRRGRVVLVALLVLLGTGASIALGGVGRADPDAAPTRVRYVMVSPGDTLWGIAGEFVPDADRRETVQRILDLNALTGVALTPGQRIAVPGR